MLPKITFYEAPNQALTPAEYCRLLAAALPNGKNVRGRVLFQLMRWSRLAIRYALTLSRDALSESGEQWRMETVRLKTCVASVSTNVARYVTESEQWRIESL